MVWNFKNDLPCGKGYCFDKYNRKCEVIYRHGKIIDVYLNEIIFILKIKTRTKNKKTMIIIKKNYIIKTIN